MANLNEIILSSGRRTAALIEPLAVGIDDADFARTPVKDGVAIDTNHPAWVYGHLAIYPARIVELLGQDTAPVDAPAEWKELFENQSVCRDDATGTLYPKKAELVEAFKTRHDAAMAAVESADEGVLHGETPENVRSYFPTVGSAAAFLLGGHAMFHLGQVSAWRRVMGLPSAT